MPLIVTYSLGAHRTKAGGINGFSFPRHRVSMDQTRRTHRHQRAWVRQSLTPTRRPLQHLLMLLSLWARRPAGLERPALRVE